MLNTESHILEDKFAWDVVNVKKIAYIETYLNRLTLTSP